MIIKSFDRARARADLTEVKLNYWIVKRDTKRNAIKENLFT